MIINYGYFHVIEQVFNTMVGDKEQEIPLLAAAPLNGQPRRCHMSSSWHGFMFASSFPCIVVLSRGTTN